MGGICGQKNGHASPSATQVSGIMQPMESMGPGQLIMPSPQSMGGICGQKNGHSSPSATQISGIMHPMGSMSPGQFVIPSPQSMGGIGGQGAGTARAVEKRVKRRTDISRLTLPM